MIAIEATWENEIDECEIREKLRIRYLESLRRADEEITTLRQVIVALVEWSVSRQELVRWAIEAGYSSGYVRTLVCRILKDLGLRCRKPGAGRKIPREALALRTLAKKHYGDQARKFLLAAYRADQKELPNQFELAGARNRSLGSSPRPADLIV